MKTESDNKTIIRKEGHFPMPTRVLISRAEKDSEIIKHFLNLKDDKT